jgi:hypothetical protein
MYSKKKAAGTFVRSLNVLLAFINKYLVLYFLPQKVAEKCSSLNLSSSSSPVEKLFITLQLSIMNSEAYTQHTRI